MSQILYIAKGRGFTVVITWPALVKFKLMIRNIAKAYNLGQNDIQLYYRNAFRLEEHHCAYCYNIFPRNEAYDLRIKFKNKNGEFEFI